MINQKEIIKTAGDIVNNSLWGDKVDIYIHAIKKLIDKYVNDKPIIFGDLDIGDFVYEISGGFIKKHVHLAVVEEINIINESCIQIVTNSDIFDVDKKSSDLKECGLFISKDDAFKASKNGLSKFEN